MKKEGVEYDNVRYVRKISNKHICLKIKQLVWTPVDNSLMPGGYEAGFAFQLPMDCPSSMLYHDTENFWKKAKVAITYVIEAKLSLAEGKL